MAEIDPTSPDILVPPDAGELLRVTFWHNTNEIDVVPEAAITHYPDYPNDDFDVIPSQLAIYTTPTPAIAQRIFRDFRALYEVAGTGTFNLMEFGRAVELPFSMAWDQLERLNKVLPDNVLALDMRERLIRHRSVTLGNVVLAEEKRKMGLQEWEMRQVFRRSPPDEAMELQERRALYKLRPKLIDLQADDEQKRQLCYYNHAAVVINGNSSLLTLTTPEGRLALRCLEQFKRFASGSDKRIIHMTDLRKHVWAAMTIEERRYYVTELRQLCDPRAEILKPAIKHMCNYFSGLMPNDKPLVRPLEHNMVVFYNTPMRISYALNPPAEQHGLSPLAVAPFTEEITTALPKELLEVPEFNTRAPRRQRGHR